MASFVIGPFATFSRPLIDEEVPTLYSFATDDWAIDMDLDPQRGVVELSTAITYPQHTFNAPKLARQHDRAMRRDRG